MSPRPLAAALAAALTLALPVAAHAADAPLRSIAFDATGARSDAFVAKYATGDGRLVAAEVGGQPALRDVAAGTTRNLPFTGELVGASDDLSVLLVSTRQSLTAADADDLPDLYAYRRSTGALTLISPAATLNAAWPSATAGTLEQNPALSGDGTVATFEADHYRPGSGTNTVFSGSDAWRYDLTTGALTKTSTTPAARDAGSSRQVTGELLSANGATRVDSTGITAGTKHYGLPSSLGIYGVSAAVSPDGSAVALTSVIVASTLQVVNTTTGAITPFTLPASLKNSQWNLRAVENGGASVVLDTIVDRGASVGQRFVLSRAQKDGTATQLGGDIISAGSGFPTYSTNLAFAASDVFLAQLGSVPLPGSEPAQPSSATAFDYLTTSDVYCTKSFFGWTTWYRGFVFLDSGPKRTDPRTPSKADIVVLDTATRRTIDTFSLNPASRHDIHVGRKGGWSVMAKVTFTDGTSVSGLKPTPAHAAPTCKAIL